METDARCGYFFLGLVFFIAFGIPGVYYYVTFVNFQNGWTPADSCNVTNVVATWDSYQNVRAVFNATVDGSSSGDHFLACTSVNAHQGFGGEGCVQDDHTCIDERPYTDGPNVPAAWKCTPCDTGYAVNHWALPYFTDVCAYKCVSKVTVDSKPVRQCHIVVDQLVPFVDWYHATIFFSFCYLLAVLFAVSMFLVAASGTWKLSEVFVFLNVLGIHNYIHFGTDMLSTAEDDILFIGTICYLGGYFFLFLSRLERSKKCYLLVLCLVISCAFSIFFMVQCAKSLWFLCCVFLWIFNTICLSVFLALRMGMFEEVSSETGQPLIAKS